MYNGQNVLIPLGGGGLQTDLPQSRISPTKLIEARNVTLVNGYCEKAPGSRRWNQVNPFTGSTTVSGGIAAFIEFFPSPYNQRVIVLGKSGTVYKFLNSQEIIQLTAGTNTATPPITSPSLLNIGQQPHLVIGGVESVGKPRKVFIFTGLNQIQVIDGDSNAYRQITAPNNDWSTNYPTFGLIYRSRLWVFGNSNLPDFLYLSEEGNYENFVIPGTTTATSPRLFDVFPGDGEGISGAFVFKNRLFICKNPTGLYQLNDEDVNPDNWYFTRVNADFGLSSSHGIAQIFDDVLLFNTQGSITLLSAAFQFGDISSSDIFNTSMVERYFRQIVSGYGIPKTQSLYYPDKKQIYFTIQSKSSLKNDMIVTLDIFGKESQITINDKDGANYFALISDDSGISRPFYASDDGNIYSLDGKNRVSQYTAAGLYILDDYVDDGYFVSESIGGTAYNMVVQTPYLDFGFVDPSVSVKTKTFDFLELTFQPTGDWSVYADIYIDSELKETLSFNLLRDRPLASVTPSLGVVNGFQLDIDRLDGDYPKSVRKPLHGQGRTISVKLRSNGYSQDIKLQSLMIYFRVSDERQIRDLRV
jgi:hypothetical protein